MKNFLIKRPMLLSALAASVVSVVAMYAERALFAICLLIVCCIFTMIFKRISGEVIFAVFCILCVAVCAVFKTADISKVENYKEVDCSGEFTVIDTPVEFSGVYRATLETVSSNVLNKGDKITVFYYDGAMEFSQKIKADLTVSALENNQYKNSYYSNGVFLSGSVNEFSYVGQEPILSVIDSVRTYIKTEIFGYFPKPSAATVMALLTGDKSYFSNEFYANVKSAGVAHIMVVSGMHLSIIVTGVLYLINKFLYNRHLKAITIFAVTLAVSALCGFTMSILRAGITYVFLGFALLFNRQNTSVNTLGAAVTVILMFNPFAVFSVAFQLSVLSTFAILVVSLPIIEATLKKGIIKNKILISVFTSVVISLSTLLFTAPVSIYIFGYVSTVSVITNLLINFAVSAAMILCLLGFAVPFAKSFFFGLSVMAVRYINCVIDYFGSLSFATVDLPEYTAFIFAGIICFVLYILLACKKRRDMIKLKEIRDKKSTERGRKLNGSNFRTNS